MVQLADSLGGSVILSGVIVKNGKEILTVLTEPPFTAITGIQKKVE